MSCVKINRFLQLCAFRKGKSFRNGFEERTSTAVVARQVFFEIERARHYFRRLFFDSCADDSYLSIQAIVHCSVYRGKQFAAAHRTQNLGYVNCVFWYATAEGRQHLRKL